VAARAPHSYRAAASRRYNGRPAPFPDASVRNHDSVFLKHFSQVIAILVGITIALILLGMYINGLKPVEENPVATAATVARIAPVGQVYAGATGAAAQAAAAAAAAEAAHGQGAYRGTHDGATIFGNLCTGCHTAGVALAPKLEKAAWAARIAQGVETLHAHAINGYNGPDGGVMPAKGGNPALSDEQVKATVDWMLTQLK
jgi:cytochrome c5